MKTYIYTTTVLLLFFYITGTTSLIAEVNLPQEFREYKGEVIDGTTGDPVPSALLSLTNTNISTVTNAEGVFSLKVPINITVGTVTISNLGYQSKTLPLDYFQRSGTKIELEKNPEQLSEVSLYTATDAKALVRNMFKQADQNYFQQPVAMDVFYRESIRNRRRNVSLTEAVLEIYKKPYSSNARDEISVTKARKSVDYKRLDTMALKLRGGPFNTLYSDIIKYPQYLFSPAEMDDYTFTMGKPARINDRYLYVVEFEMKAKNLPWYFGELFIDAETNALKRAIYYMNIDNRRVAADMFVKKKPSGARVYPISVRYQIDYREQDGRWYYGYGSAELEFVVNWRRKLFNTRYTVQTEMAVTDWDIIPNTRIKRDDSFINPNVIMADNVSGFYDPEFWGSNNIIEPDKSIENAIEKIQERIQ